MSSSDPLVSVGIPVYNGDRFIADALDSLLKQTFEDFEVIVSDNASTDRTEEICRDYARRDKRIRVFRNEQNIGSVKNFNRLFALSKGRYFKWAAHDDILAPTYLERCVELLDSDRSVVLAAPRVKLIEEDGSLVPFDARRGVFVTRHGEEMRAIDPGRRYSAPEPHIRFHDVVLYLRSSVLTAYNYGVARSGALARTRLFEPYIGAEKVYLAHLSLIGRFEEIDEELFYWRLHPSHVGTKSAREITRTLDPEWSGLVTFMGLRQVFGYARAIREGPGTLAQKSRCALVLAEKAAAVSRTKAGRLAQRFRAGRVKRSPA